MESMQNWHGSGDLVTIAKMDGTANDSPVDALDSRMQMTAQMHQGIASSQFWSTSVVAVLRML